MKIHDILPEEAAAGLDVFLRMDDARRHAQRERYQLNPQLARRREELRYREGELAGCFDIFAPEDRDKAERIQLELRAIDAWFAQLPERRNKGRHR